MLGATSGILAIDAQVKKLKELVRARNENRREIVSRRLEQILREAQGLVRYKGRWISKQEKEHRESLAATGVEQASWVRRLKLLRQTIVNGPDDRRRDAELQLMEIRDPIAVTPLLQVLGGENVPLRIPEFDADDDVVHRSRVEVGEADAGCGDAGRDPLVNPKPPQPAAQHTSHATASSLAPLRHRMRHRRCTAANHTRPATHNDAAT